MEFERLIADLFRRAHFRVDRAPSAARPRQTDLLATGTKDTFLIECKWRKRRAGSEDVDGLRSRLDRIPGPTTGILISVSGFTKDAVDEVEGERSKPILLFAEEELDELADEWGDLRQTLSLKQDALKINGRAHLLSRTPTRAAPHRREPRPLREGDSRLVDNRGVIPWLASAGGFGHFTFSCHLGIEWTFGDVAFTLDIPLHSLSRQDDLIRAMGELGALGWTTGRGQWCLHQSGINWHGAGAASLVEALNQREARYRGMGRIHHTEELSYYDECDGGFYTITADLDARDGDVSYAALSLQLAGIPFDREALDELCRTFEVRSPMYFRPRVSMDALEGAAHLSRRPVSPVALLIHEDPDDPHDRLWVRGIVARNPFLGKTSEDVGASDLPWVVRDTEIIVCDLRNWHPLSDPHTYNLEQCRWTYSSQATVVRLVVDWPDSELPDAVKVGHPRTADAPRSAFVQVGRVPLDRD